MKVLYNGKLNKSGQAEISSALILDVLQRTELELTSNLLNNSDSEQTESLLHTMGVGMLGNFDAILLEVTEIEQQASYLLAQAVLQKKPTLCLYQKNKIPRQLVVFLKQKHIPKCIQIKSYSKDSVQKTIYDFLKNINSEITEIEVPYFRFTLRLTPSLDEYLSKAADKAQVSKADYLRDLLAKTSEKKD